MVLPAGMGDKRRATALLGLGVLAVGHTGLRGEHWSSGRKMGQEHPWGGFEGSRDSPQHKGPEGRWAVLPVSHQTLLFLGLLARGKVAWGCEKRTQTGAGVNQRRP